MILQFGILFSPILFGYVAKKTGILKDKLEVVIKDLLIYLFFPCLIVKTFATMKIEKGLVDSFLAMVVISLLAYIIYTVIVKIYMKVRRFKGDDLINFEAGTIFPNNGFMGLPVANLFLGDLGVVLIMANSSIMNFYLFTYGNFLFEKKEDLEGHKLKVIIISLFKALTNPMVLSLFVGVFAQIYKLPMDNIVGEILRIGQITTPLAMFVVGTSLAEGHPRELINSKFVWEAVFMRMIIMPIIAILAMLYVPYDSSFKMIFVISFCFPTAVMVPILVVKSGRSPLDTSKMLFVSTALSIILLPIYIYLLEVIF